MSLAVPGAWPKSAETTDVQSISWGKRLFPILLIQAYLWLSIGLYAFGPWQWPMRDPGKFYGFVFACHFALLIGYLAFAHRAPRASTVKSDPIKLIGWTVVATIMVAPLTNYAKTGSWVPDILGSIANPGQAYMESHLYTEQGTNAGAYVRIVLGPLLMGMTPLVAFYWRRMDTKLRLAAAIAIASAIVLSVSTGQRRDIADLLVTLPLIAVAGHWARVTVFRRRTQFMLLIGFVIGCAGFISYFAYSHISRVGADTAAYAVNPATMQHPDRNNPMLLSIPEEYQPGFLAFVNYLSTGYYGLSLSLDRPQQPMYGFGHSMFLTRNAQKLMGDETFEQRSLAVQISNKDGFKYPVYWATAYPYFLNDLGPFGVILLMLGIGALLATTWIDTIGGQNPYAVVMFWLVALLLFYLPATNRVLQDGEGVVAFYVWLLIYLYHRSRNRKALQP